MKLETLRDPQRRAVHVEGIVKKLRRRFAAPCPTSVPVFVFGMQRSGTSMLMNVLHLRRDTEVYDENKESRAFVRHRLRDLNTIKQLISDSRASYVCFKPIADSHRIDELLEQFPDSRAIWIYRDYKDVANSRLRKFSNVNRAIRLVCQGLPGGGWFDDGVSDATRKILTSMDVDALTEFDFACLTWWARNRIYIENELWNNDSILLVKYEQLVTSPIGTFDRMLSHLGMPPEPRSLRHVHQTSIGKNAAPPVNAEVETLCLELERSLDGHLV